MMLALGYLLESIGFPPREDLWDLSDPDVWTPIVIAYALLLH